MKPAADEAVAEAPSIEHVVVLERLGVDVPMTPGRDLTWDELRARGVASHGASSPRTPPPRTRS